MAFVVAIGVLFAAAAAGVMGSDPDPLQDFCVAVGKVSDPSPTYHAPPSAYNSPPSEYNEQEDPTKAKHVTMTSSPNSTDMSSVTININGAICKDPKLVKGEDFLFKELTTLGDTNNMVGSKVTAANIAMFLGINTLGISFARIDFAKKGVNPPHVHPRATEILLVIEGSLKVGFVDTNNKLFTATVNKGELFVFPRGLVHFQENVGYENALAFAGLNSQNPGTQQIAPAVFGADPPISDQVLQKAFGLGGDAVDALQKTFGKDKESQWRTAKY